MQMLVMEVVQDGRDGIYKCQVVAHPAPTSGLLALATGSTNKQTGRRQLCCFT